MLKIVKEEGAYLVTPFQVSKLNTIFAELISDQLRELVSVEGRRVILNLENISFIDSSGFNVLEGVVATAMKYNATFHVCNVSDDVEELMELTGHHSVLNVIPRMNVRERILMEPDD